MKRQSNKVTQPVSADTAKEATSKELAEMTVPELVLQFKASRAEFLKTIRLLHIAFEQVGLDDTTMHLVNEGRRLVAQADDDCIPF